MGRCSASRNTVHVWYRVMTERARSPFLWRGAPLEMKSPITQEVIRVELLLGQLRWLRHLIHHQGVDEDVLLSDLYTFLCVLTSI